MEPINKELEFGKRLAAFRERHHISCRDFAAIAKGRPHTSASAINRMENGRVNPKIRDEALAAIEETIRHWMHDRGFAPDQIDAQVEDLFCFEEREMIIHRCELIAPAIKHFGLAADPFDVDRVPGDNEMFTNKDLDHLAARVKDAVLYKRFVAITGPVGTGKTSLKIRVARELAAWSEKTADKVYLIYPEFFDMNQVNVGAIAASILQEFEIPVPHSSTARVRRIKEQLTGLEKDGARVALVFDECHRLNEKVIIALKNFWEMTNGGYARLLGIVLFGQPRFVEATLRDYKFREIAERVQILEMPSIVRSAHQYLAHKIAAAGGDIDSLFEPKAIQRICSVARTPLALGNVANAALMEAFRLEEPQVASAMLKLPDAPQIRQMRAA